MTGIAFSRRNRRSKLYLEVIRSLRDNVAVPHLAPAQTAYQPFQTKSDRHRHDAAEYRQHGGGA